MALFTNPFTITVNSVARIFNFRYNRQEGKSVVGEYFEPAAPLAEGGQLISKQDLGSSTVDRSLLSYRVNKLIADGVTYKPIVVNFTTVFHKEHTEAQRDDAMEIVAEAVATDSFRQGVSQRLV